MIPPIAPRVPVRGPAAACGQCSAPSCSENCSGAFRLPWATSSGARSRSTILRKRRRSHPVFADCTPCAATPTARNAALPASFARRYARRWRSRLNPRCAKTAHGGPAATTSTCSSACIAAFARRPARWTPS